MNSLIKNKKLKFLNLSNNQLEDQAIISIIVTQDSLNLEHLDLSENNFQQRSIMLILEKLNNINLK